MHRLTSALILLGIFTLSGSSDGGTACPRRRLSPAGVVRGLVATQHGAGLYLTWNPTANATGYEIAYGTSDDVRSATSAGASTVTSTMLSPLAANTAYWVWVRAISTDDRENAFASVPAQTSE